MTIIKKLAVFIIIGMLLSACQPTATPTPTTTVLPPTPVVVTATPIVEVVTSTPVVLPTVALPTVALPTVTSTSLPTVAPTATASSPSGLPDYSVTAYLDDLSTPATEILSYVNAINRHEYLRAYSYWGSPSGYIGTLDAFTNSFANTTSETIALGQVVGEGAAGSVYYTLPTAVTDTLNGGGTAKYAICFILRYPQAANYGAPPITPMNIDQYTKTSVSTSTSDAAAITNACSGSDAFGLPSSPVTVDSLSDISANNYIDNRSGAIEVVSSLFNAINSKEYVRAYSYYQNAATYPGSYTTYAAGYNDTGSVTATFGTVTSDAGAGQFHYQVPLAMKVTTTSNTLQTFVGCYTLHLANPGMQGTLPFQPLGITAGKFVKVANNVNVVPLLTTACN